MLLLGGKCYLNGILFFCSASRSADAGVETSLSSPDHWNNIKTEDYIWFYLFFYSISILNKTPFPTFHYSSLTMLNVVLLCREVSHEE